MVQPGRPDRLPEIVARAANGNVSAFDELIRLIRPDAIRFCYILMSDYGLAEDATQEALAAMFFKLDQLREPAAFGRWFRRILHKHCDRITRKREHRNVSLEAVQEPWILVDPAARVYHDQITRELELMLERIPHAQRTAVRRFYYEGQSLREIAEFVGVHEKTVKSRLFEARSRLRRLLADDMRERARGHRAVFGTLGENTQARRAY